MIGYGVRDFEEIMWEISGMWVCLILLDTRCLFFDSTVVIYSIGVGEA
jgi:hypothetical protein